jgi:hypothetical protein
MIELLLAIAVGAAYSLAFTITFGALRSLTTHEHYPAREVGNGEALALSTVWPLMWVLAILATIAAWYFGPWKDPR